MLGISFHTFHKRGGEKMKKKILTLTMTIFVMVVMTLPMIPTAQARGCRRRTIIEEVTLVLDHTPTPVGDPRYVGDDIIIQRGISTGKVTLNIPGQDPLIGDFDDKWVSITNTAEVVRIFGRTKLIFDGGMFVGVTYTEWIDFPPPGPTSNMKFQWVFFGTGDFAGQTLKLSFEAFPPPPNWPAYLIVHK